MKHRTGDIREAVGNIKTSDYAYVLPGARIARYPLAERSHSKLLVWKDGEISQTLFARIPGLLPPGSLMVFNNTQVVWARLFFRKETGAQIEIFCLEPHEPSGYEQIFSQTGRVEWRCLVGNARKWKSGKLKKTICREHPVLLTIEQVKKEGNQAIIRFEWDEKYTFGEVLDRAGIIPIPPYLNRESEEMDHTRYQTVYAKIKGSVAAPTAGLHFTGEVLKEVQEKGIHTEEITLHVSAGTFQPVKTDTVGHHAMHNETIVVTLRFLKRLLRHPTPVVAVGTTSVRTLESLYWLGVQFVNNKTGKGPFHVSQWEPYEEDIRMEAKEALLQIIAYLERNQLETLDFSTRLMIVPGYRFRIIDGMLTNFHQPRSTLLLLIAAFLGDDWRRVYDYALQHDFRFLSYGDSNLYWKRKP
jgi:S-adenosylmethionine:tRNA ribosyltransferase-isomerase